MRARDNPFNTDSVLGVRYRLRGPTWEELLARMEEMGYRAAIVGPHGSGKTTLLEDLEPRLAALGFSIIRLRLDAETRSFDRKFLKSLFRTLSERDVLLFDGAEQMSRLAWLIFKRRTKRAAGLIVTSHDRRRLPTLIECRTSPELLHEIIVELTGDEAGARSAVAATLHAKHRGNLRDALREMYDVYSERY
ncbi:MAG TPA: hypothetical protein VKA70_09905 [Blastocatellia bacterium]|nr:hypothetical protein [Blastocatellia bacterium]